MDGEGKDLTPKIIGISGKTGAGKTTLTKALAQALQATTLYWDDFDEISGRLCGLAQAGSGL